MMLAWRCPSETGADRPPASKDALPGDLAFRLGRVERMTGCTGLTTCPNWYPRQPWVHRAALAYRAREKGSLASVAPRPSMALVLALDEIERGVSDAQREQNRRDRVKRNGGGE